MSNELPQPELRLRGFTYSDRADILPELGVSIDHAGGWVLERRTLSANVTEMIMEVSINSLADVYAAFVGTGLELTRDSHRAMAQRVTCSLHMRPQRGISSIILVSLEMQFLDSPPQPLDLIQRYPQACARA